jgi:hypothetical protein
MINKKRRHRLAAINLPAKSRIRSCTSGLSVLSLNWHRVNSQRLTRHSKQKSQFTQYLAETTFSWWSQSLHGGSRTPEDASVRQWVEKAQDKIKIGVACETWEAWLGKTIFHFITKIDWLMLLPEIIFCCYENCMKRTGTFVKWYHESLHSNRFTWRQAKQWPLPFQRVVTRFRRISVRFIAVNILFSMLSGSLSPRHGASSGCGWRNGLQVWRVAANTFNKQSRTADKGWSSSLGVGRGANNSSP